jgi:hypothetical protein
MTFKDFHTQIYSVIETVLNDTESHPPSEEIPVPADFSDLLAILRGVAEDLALCVSVDTTIATLRQDRGALPAVLFLITELPEDVLMSAERRAYEQNRVEATILPGIAFASYLLEICNGLEIT